MTKTDYNQPGGFPLSQARLAYMQEGYTEGFEALISTVDDGSTPVRLTGVTFSGGGFGHYNDGYIIYQGDLIRFSGGAGFPLGVSDVVMVVINDVSSTLTYKNGSTPAVLIERIASVYAGPSLTDATHFPFDDIIDYAEQLGRLSREGWNSLSLSHATGAVSGTLYYKKNQITNQLEYNFVFGSATPSALASVPVASTLTIGTLPAGYVPSQTIQTCGNLSGLFGYFMLLSVGGYINQIRIVISASSGDISTTLPKPDASISIFSVTASGTASLD